MRRLIIAVATMLLPALASAEPVPMLWLANFHESCMANHGKKPSGPAYCMCLTVRANEMWTAQKFATLDAEAERLKAARANRSQVSASLPELEALERACLGRY